MRRAMAKHRTAGHGPWRKRLSRLVRRGALGWQVGGFALRQGFLRRIMAAMAMGLVAQRGHLVTWVPVFFGLGIAVYFHLPREPAPWLIGFAVVLLPSGLVLARVLPLSLAPFGLGLTLIAAGGLTALVRAHVVAAPVLDFRYYGPVQGRVVEIDRSSGDQLRLTLDRVVLDRMDPDDTPAKVRVTLSQGPPAVMAQSGDVVILTAHLSPPNGPVEPGDFDFRMQAWFEGLGAVGYTRSPVLRLMPSEDHLDLWVARTRYTLSQGLQLYVRGDPGGLAAAVMTGDRAGLSQGASDAMRDANLYHLVSISGMHMGMLVAIIFAATRGGLALVPYAALHWPLKMVAALVALPAALFYLLLAGRDVATERAFVMSAVMLGAILCDRQAVSLRVVALAGLGVLALRPEALFNAGFQMSFAAVVALVAVFQRVSALRGQLTAWRWLMPTVMLLLSSLVAGLATAPYAAAHFNRVAHYGLIANLLAVPVMGFVVMPAAIFMGLSAPFGVTEPARSLIAWGSGWIVWVSSVIAGWEGAVSLVARPPNVVLPLITFAGLMLCLWQGRGRWLGVPLALCALGFWGYAARPALLIAQSGGIVGVMGPEGRALSRPDGEAFTAQNWRDNDGDSRPQSLQLDGMNVQGRLAEGDIGGLRLIALRGQAALAALPACGGADILVSSVVVDDPRPCLVLDPRRLALSGAIAGYATPEGVRLVTAAGLSGQRLWTGPPARGRTSRCDQPATTTKCASSCRRIFCGVKSDCRSIAADQPDQTALHAHLIFTVKAGLICGVGRFQSDHLVLAAIMFQRGFLFFDQGHDNIAIISVRGFADHDDIAIIDACVDHRIAAHFQRVMIPTPDHALRHGDVVRNLGNRGDRHTCGDAAHHGQFKRRGDCRGKSLFRHDSRGSGSGGCHRTGGFACQGFGHFDNFNRAGAVGKAADKSALFQGGDQPMDARFRPQIKRILHFIEGGGDAVTRQTGIDEFQQIVLLFRQHNGHFPKVFGNCSCTVLPLCQASCIKCNLLCLSRQRNDRDHLARSRPRVMGGLHDQHIGIGQHRKQRGILTVKQHHPLGCHAGALVMFARPVCRQITGQRHHLAGRRSRGKALHRAQKRQHEDRATNHRTHRISGQSQHQLAFTFSSHQRLARTHGNLVEGGSETGGPRSRCDQIVIADRSPADRHHQIGPFGEGETLRQSLHPVLGDGQDAGLRARLAQHRLQPISV